jgi:hypothetical protein
MSYIRTLTHIAGKNKFYTADNCAGENFQERTKQKFI